MRHGFKYEKVCTSKKVKNKDKAVSFGENGMDLYVRLEEVEVCLRNDGSICSGIKSGSIPKGRIHT